MSLQHQSIIDSADTFFVIGAAIFTSLLSEGISISLAYSRHFMVAYIQKPRVQNPHWQHHESFKEDRETEGVLDLSRSSCQKQDLRQESSARRSFA